MTTARSNPNESVRVGSDPATWLDTHGDHLFRFAMLRVRKTELAEDMVQETLTAALRARDAFEGQSSERTWLVSILQRKIVDHMRQAARERPVSDVTSSDEVTQDFFDKRGGWKRKPAAWSANPLKTLEQQEFWDAFAACLSKLPRRVADTFCLREIDHIGSSEVCKVLGITPSNLWTQLHRGRLLLRRCLEQTWFEGEARGTAK